MSLRRKSCNACFRGRRKCDLGFPVCARCQKNQKACHYVASSSTERRNKPGTSNREDLGFSNEAIVAIRSPSRLPADENEDWNFAVDVDFQQSNLIEDWLHFSIPSFLGDLGELQPVSGNTKSWEWVVEQLRSYPRMFALTSETIFLHKESYRDHLPSSIRVAFGICSAHTNANSGNDQLMFRVMDAEVNEQLKPKLNETLLEGLSSFQALALYQIIRMYHGDLKQRILAERQESSMTARGLQLLRRADLEFRNDLPTLENWIVAESIRRTVMTIFMLYAVYSLFKHGICAIYPTLSILPVSSTPEMWKSSPTNLQHPRFDETMKYSEYTDKWVSLPQIEPEPFEKMLLVACKGIDQVEALVIPDLFS
jgi:hypothetical protein